MAHPCNVLSVSVDEVETVRQSWTDERLDDMSRRMDQGFARVDAELHALQRILIQIGFVMSASLIGVIATMAGLILTQL